MPVSITVEPLTSDLRERSGRQADPNHLAVVHSQGLGELVAVVATTDDHNEAYQQAHEFAPTVDGQVLTGSSYRPTVVGRDVAALVIADPRNQPTAITPTMNPVEHALLLLDELFRPGTDRARFTEVCDEVTTIALTLDGRQREEVNFRAAELAQRYA